MITPQVQVADLSDETALRTYAAMGGTCCMRCREKLGEDVCVVTMLIAASGEPSPVGRFIKLILCVCCSEADDHDEWCCSRSAEAYLELTAHRRN